MHTHTPLHSTPLYQTLDKTMKGFGFPVGPVTLADEVGIDVANHVGVFLGDKLDNRMGVRATRASFPHQPPPTPHTHPPPSSRTGSKP